MITFIDDASGFAALHFLRSKADAVTALQDLVSWAEAQTGYHLHSICSDRGGEYINQSLKTFLSSKGIEHQTSVPQTPQQNGRAERFNRTILEKSEAMRQHACLPPFFWQDAVETTLHIYNRQPMCRLDWSTPISKWNGDVPDVSYFKVFGSLAYVLIPKEDRQNKLSAKAEEATFIGYEKGTKGYKFWSPKRRRVVISSTATFDEFTFFFVPERQMTNHPCCLFHSTVITSRSLINQTNLNHRKTFRPLIITNFNLWKINTPIHRSLLKKVMMINSRHDLCLQMHLLLIDHLPFLLCLMTWKNLDAEQEFVIPVFFLTTPMAIDLLSKSNEI